MFFHRQWDGNRTSTLGSAESPIRNLWCEVHAAATAFGLIAGYTREDIDAAFRRLARKVRPDVGGTDEAFETLVAQRDLLLREAGRANSPRIEARTR